jgi:hypothetical protein
MLLSWDLPVERQQDSGEHALDAGRGKKKQQGPELLPVLA